MGRRLAGRWAGLLGAGLLPLAGCGSLLTEGASNAGGLAGAGIAGAITKEAAIGAGIGLAVKSVADFALRSVERDVHRAEQDAIATVAGGLHEGGAGAWSVAQSIPIERDEHGALVVTRAFAAVPVDGTGFSCKEIVFSVERGEGATTVRSFYTATVCLDGGTWKWASAEPATERWGTLQ